ncbi:hypothetical protein [Sphingomonas arenae]|uniref:hypothetical protein n=1 Tax=Sphingomonas arenae TaxID=2812555 RepID=UPI0019686431|nr:hypothetical protein [Sphingomonas arenae]
MSDAPVPVQAHEPSPKEPSGRRNAIARENQLLPGHWTQLGEIDLARIRTAIAQSRAKQASKATLEACLMLLSVLSTGRRMGELISLTFRFLAPEYAISAAEPGLIFHDKRWSWWLSSGGPARQIGPQMAEMMVPTSKNVWLSVSDETELVLRDCLKARKIYAHAGAQRLFETDAGTLQARVLALLNRRMPGEPRVRRSARTIESAERWLMRVIAQDAGGDIAAASLITARHHPLARPMTYYGALPMPRASNIHRQALRRLGQPSAAEFPSELAGLWVGESFTPKDEAVRTLARRLGRNLRFGGNRFWEAHAGMSAYTVALVAFGLGLRGRGGVLPSFEAIDRRTGFLQVHDKYRDDPAAARLVWVCECARTQLSLYHDHLLAMDRHLPSEARAWLRTSLNSPAAPLFQVTSSGEMQARSLKQVLHSLRSKGWPGHENAGRHWLRSKLVGKVSGETLGAFFGHWHHGVQPWGLTSALDPMSYQADLKPVLDPALAWVGWTPIASPLAQ